MKKINSELQKNVEKTYLKQYPLISKFLYHKNSNANIT